MRRGKKGETRKVVVPLPCDSEIEKFYLQEAQSCGIGLPTLFCNLLMDRYEAISGNGRNVWFPRGVPQSIDSSPVTSQDDGDRIKIQAELAKQFLGGEDE